MSQHNENREQSTFECKSKNRRASEDDLDCLWLWEKAVKDDEVLVRLSWMFNNNILSM